LLGDWLGPGARLDRVFKRTVSTPAGNATPILQPLASLYTDWTIRTNYFTGYQMKWFRSKYTVIIQLKNCFTRWLPKQFNLLYFVSGEKNELYFMVR
jgi:hypothetical protein